MTGIALYSPKHEKNLGSIMRIAYNYNVDFICLIANRYRRVQADTPNATKHIPTFFYKNVEDFVESYPKSCILINLETKNSRNLEQFNHPKNSIYVFGPEEGNIPDELLKLGINLKIESRQCLNQAVCAGNVLFHRHLQFYKP